ncbi:hypothetical protein EYF80_050690 [Liparis tanakae]|uniref:Uncharacterized protein n=1 Tax=Liparis tanakae TaxID=230148 RepID=A0A4Z2FD09_9TELE|nr:hypothetical protein EYF80_050690 [Liparis tanakae]
MMHSGRKTDYGGVQRASQRSHGDRSLGGRESVGVATERGQRSLTLPFCLRGSMLRLSAPMSTMVPSWKPSAGCGAHTGFPSSIALQHTPQV